MRKSSYKSQRPSKSASGLQGKANKAESTNEMSTSKYPIGNVIGDPRRLRKKKRSGPSHQTQRQRFDESGAGNSAEVSACRNYTSLVQ